MTNSDFGSTTATDVLRTSYKSSSDLLNSNLIIFGHIGHILLRNYVKMAKISLFL